MFQAEIDQMLKIQAEVNRLEGEGLAVPAEDQISHFQGAVQSEAVRSGVNIINSGKPTTQTNQFFVEHSQNLGVQAKEQALVDFLFNLGSGNSLIRVRDLSVRPEPQHHELSATIKLVASYQKRTPTLTTTPATQKSTAPKASAPVQNQPPPSQRTVKPATTATNAPARPLLPSGGKPTPSNNKRT